jgi:hypothetical protein
MTKPGERKLLILVAGFLILYIPLFIMTMITSEHWLWLTAAMSCLGLYLTGFITGIVKGWWR